MRRCHAPRGSYTFLETYLLKSLLYVIVGYFKFTTMLINIPSARL